MLKLTGQWVRDAINQGWEFAYVPSAGIRSEGVTIQ